MTFPINLWDGLEECLARLTRGKHDAQAMHAHLLERAKIEDQYAKAMTNVCKLAPFENDGTITACWLNVTSTGSSNAGQHSQFSTMCNDVAAELDKLVVFLRQTRQSAMERHDKVFKARDLAQKAHAKAKSFYHECISKAEKAITDLETAKASGIHAKKVPQLTKTATSCIQAVDKSNTDYKKAVESLEHSEADYDRTVHALLEEIETAETKRSTLCKALFQRYTQAQEFMKHSLEQIQTVSFQVLLAADPDLDRRNFISAAYTGQAGPPPHVTYEYKPSAVIDKHRGFSGEPAPSGPPAAPERKVSDPEDSPRKVDLSHGKLPKSLSAMNLASPSIATPSLADYSPSPSPAPYPTLLSVPSHSTPVKQAPPAAQTAQETRAAASSIAGTPPALSEPIAERGRAGSHVRRISSSGLASVKSGPGTAAYVPVWAFATHNYSSEEPTDLSFAAGQRILLLHFPVSEDWWTGDLDGRSGTFPKNRVRMASVPPETVHESATSETEKGSGYRPMNGTCVALHEFIGQEQDELTFKPNEELVILGIVDGWYVGHKLNDERQGIFPCVYVKLTSTIPA